VRIALCKLAPGTTRFEFDWTPGTIGLLDPISGAKATETVRGWLELTPLGEDAESGPIRLKGRVETTIAQSCSRCLEETAAAKRVEFELVLVSSFDEALPERELKGDDLKEALLQGEELDLVELVREQLLLELGMISLCNPDCKGLCPGCGQNLNLSPCGCQTKEADPRLTALSQWRPDLEPDPGREKKEKES